MKLADLHPELVLDTEDQLWFDCPGGCGDRIGIPLKPSRSGGWDNTDIDDFSKTTLSPSIGYNPIGEHHHWHGWIRSGEIEHCGDSKCKGKMP